MRTLTLLLLLAVSSPGAIAAQAELAMPQALAVMLEISQDVHGEGGTVCLGRNESVGVGGLPSSVVNSVRAIHRGQLEENEEGVEVVPLSECPDQEQGPLHYLRVGFESYLEDGFSIYIDLGERGHMYRCGGTVSEAGAVEVSCDSYWNPGGRGPFVRS